MHSEADACAVQDQHGSPAGQCILLVRAHMLRHDIDNQQMQPMHLSGGGRPSAMVHCSGVTKASARTVRPSYRSATTSVGLHTHMIDVATVCSHAHDNILSSCLATYSHQLATLAVPYCHLLDLCITC